MLNAATAVLYSGIRGPRLGGRGGGGLGHLGSFLVHAASGTSSGKLSPPCSGASPPWAPWQRSCSSAQGCTSPSAGSCAAAAPNAPTNLSAADPATGNPAQRTTAQCLGYSAGRCASSRPDRRPLNVGRKHRGQDRVWSTTRRAGPAARVGGTPASSGRYMAGLPKITSTQHREEPVTCENVNSVTSHPARPVTARRWGCGGTAALVGSRPSGWVPGGSWRDCYRPTGVPGRAGPIIGTGHRYRHGKSSQRPSRLPHQDSAGGRR